jgi:hypothetical protein
MANLVVSVILRSRRFRKAPCWEEWATLFLKSWAGSNIAGGIG